MDNKSRLDSTILEFSTLGDALKKKARRRAFRESFNEDCVLHARRAQSEIDSEYDKRSKELVKRLKHEVLAQLMKIEKER